MDLPNVLKIESGEERDVEVEHSLLDSGRGSVISSNSPRFQETHAKFNQVESQFEKIVQSSHRELQEAKQKLEELRLLRFEEKSLLKQEIEHLNEKVDEEEKNSTFLEDQLKTFQLDKTLYLKRLADLEKEQVIGSQINMMQEQEIVRLEMKLKEHELERFSISKQLDHQRRTIIEKDKQRMKQQGEIFILKERIAQLEESNMLVKADHDDTREKLQNSENELQTLKNEISVMSHELEDFKKENTNSRFELKQLKISNTRLEELVASERERARDIQEKMSGLEIRCQTEEAEFQKREGILQQDLDHASFNESKLSEKYEELQQVFHDTRRIKDEQYFELKQVQKRVNFLEEKLNQVEHLNVELEEVLTEIENTIRKHVCETDMNYSPRYSPKSDVNATRTISPEALDDYFVRNSSKMTNLQLEVTDMSSQIRMEQRIMVELNQSISDVKSQLEKTRGNLNVTAQLKEAMELQCDRANETIRIQERESERKSEEIIHLKERLKEFEDRVLKLESELTSSTNENTKLSILYKEERRSLKVKMQEIENEYQLLESMKKRQEEKSKYEISSLNEKNMKVDAHNEELKKDNHGLKSELEKLIQDNKSLAQRLIHLETYSEKIGTMLEKQQTDNGKLKEKLQIDVRNHKTLYEDKNVQISSLTQKLHDMNRSIHEKSDENEKLGGKIRNAKVDRKNLENKIKTLIHTKTELEQKVKIINEAHTAAEKKVITLRNELEEMGNRFDGQTKNIDEIFMKMTYVERENKTLRNKLDDSEKNLHLKESLIVELTKKTNKAAENVHTMKSSVRQAEIERHQDEEKIHAMKTENISLDKSMRNISDENAHLREQISKLRRLLSKTEDEKEKSFNEVTYLQRHLDSERTKVRQLNDSDQMNRQQKFALGELQTQISALEDELAQERRKRQSLEALYNKRDDQVSKLRNTFDESLNTITNDTKNIKHILGKSLQKIDRQILHHEGLVTDSDITETDGDFFNSPKKYNSNKFQHYNPPRRSKSLESSVPKIPEKVNGRSPRLHHRHSIERDQSSVLLPSSKLSLIPHEYSTGSASRDSASIVRRSSKRLTK